MPRFALAQIDLKVGDIAGNLRRCFAAVDAARDAGADAVLLPELALTGYPPEDLLAREGFVADNEDALRALAAGAAGVDVVVGFAELSGGALRNAAALLRDGSVAAVYHKRRLPNYGVFDEARYFEAGADVCLVDVAGVTCALTICEDVWVPGPVDESVAAGASVILNISASPFHAGKGAGREAMLASRAATAGAWLVYCNLVGGQDELVFDGRSAVFSPDGTLVARGKTLEEDLLLADVPSGAGAGVRAGTPRVEPALEGDEEVYAALVRGIRDYFSKNGFTDAVVGLSGGIDSALTATLAADALGAGHVHGVAMPSKHSSPGSLADAEQLAASLGIDHRVMPIEPGFQALLDTLAPSFGSAPPDIAEENLQARVRGTLLMGLSNKFGWIVLATGNKSELSVGYSTLYGDMVGGFAPIKDVYKTRVYSLARWRDRDSEVIPLASITKAPSAELRPGQLDTDTLPPYDVLDAVLRLYIEERASREGIAARGFDRPLVDRVCGMVDAAEYKRRQGPLGIKISPVAFGRDRRMPITNGYRG